MELKIYPRLSRESQRAMRKTRKSWGHTYFYRPQKRLIERLARELKMSEEAVVEQMQRERDYITGNIKYFN